MPIKTAIIIGGGIAGPAVAIALQKIGISCTIYELRQGPATIGGAIGLSPNAVRILDNWGLYEKLVKDGFEYEMMEIFSISSGKPLGQLPLGGKERFGYDALRVGREALQKLMLNTAMEAGATLKYSKKFVGAKESEEGITALFEGGDEVLADLLIGCDGIHSNVRTKYVEPERIPTYTGISSMYGFTAVSKITAPIHFRGAAMNMSHRGSLLTTYCDSRKENVFLAAVMEVKEQDERDGWRARGRVAEEARIDLLKRFETGSVPCIAEMTRGMTEVFFYPVFTLSNGGQWFKGRAILIGDAAHAMPPGGQSVGLALEDAIILSRLLSSATASNVTEVFNRYHSIRRARVEDHYKQMAERWEGTKTRSWWVQKIMEFFVWVYLAAIARHADESFTYDPTKIDL